MSIVLVMDTATEHVALGVAEVDAATGTARMLAEETVLAPRRANSMVLSALGALCDEAGVGARAARAFVAGRGPGSFTGVRICLATAKGVAHGLGVPLVGVSTLDAIARGLVDADGALGIVGDAMRGEVYPARYAVRDGAPELLGEDPGVAAPAAVAERWARELSGPITLAGNGLAKYREVFTAALGDRAAIAPEATWAPTASGLLAAAASDVAAALAGASGFDPGAALPIYTRLSDAEEAEKARRGGPVAALPESGVAGPGEGP